jgi:TPR repeat protein
MSSAKNSEKDKPSTIFSSKHLPSAGKPVAACWDFATTMYNSWTGWYESRERGDRIFTRLHFVFFRIEFTAFNDLYIFLQMFNRILLSFLFCFALSLVSGCENEDQPEAIDEVLVEAVKKDFSDYYEYKNTGNKIGDDMEKYLRAKFPERGKDWKKAAEQGLPEAQILMGWWHVFCREISLFNLHPRNPTAMKWFRKAAEQGNAEGQFCLGLRYTTMSRTGVPADWQEAIEWFHKAVKQGHVEAMYELGRCYDMANLSGNPLLPKDPAETAKAAEWYRKAAEHGHAEAQYRVARGFLQKVPRPKPETAETMEQFRKDSAEGIELLHKAAEQGNAGAQYRLGSYYYEGTHVSKDLEEAIKWLQKASEQHGWEKSTKEPLRQALEEQIESRKRNGTE